MCSENTMDLCFIQDLSNDWTQSGDDRMTVNDISDPMTVSQ